MDQESKKINTLLEELMSYNAKKDDRVVVNNLKLLVFKGNSNKLTVNVTPNLDYLEKYHGFHPSNSTKKIVEKFLNKVFTTREEFEDCLTEYCKEVLGKLNGFTLCVTDDEYKELKGLEEVLFRQAILQVCTHFGYELEVNNEILNQVSKAIEGHPQLTIQGTRLVISGVVMGINNILSGFEIQNKSRGLHLVRSEGGNLSYDGLRPKLLHGGVYYSGVMPSVKEIQEIDNSFFSDGIKAINLVVIQTTFATLDMFDNNEMIHHEIFTEEEYLLLKQFYYIEDQLQSEYLYQQECDNSIEMMNTYLKKSMNSHTIAVSSNVITSDDYLILGKRSASSIDADSYYCSANGQSEFYDKNVKFYQQSVTEDTPHLEFSQDARNNLALEIEREVESELGISDFEKSWEYYGISYLSIQNDKIQNLDDSSKISKRRMHFNVLLHNKVRTS